MTWNLVLMRALLIILLLLGLASGAWSQLLERTEGDYLGQNWHIDASGLLVWEGVPLVPVGFTGLGDVEGLGRLGLDHFVLAAPPGFATGLDATAKLQQTVKLAQRARTLSEGGATYFAALGGLLPSPLDRGPQALPKEDWLTYQVKQVNWRHLDPGTKEVKLESRLIGPGSPFPFSGLESAPARIWALDEVRGAAVEVTRAVRERKLVRRRQPHIEEDDNSEFLPLETGSATSPRAIQFSLDAAKIPLKGDLAFVVMVELKAPGTLETLPSSLAALWKPSVLARLEGALKALAPHLRASGLRGALLEDECNSYPLPLTSAVYPDFSQDEVAMAKWRVFLAAKFGDITSLNAALGTAWTSLDEAPWQAPPLVSQTGPDPLAEGPRGLFGFFASQAQLEAISALQDEFRLKLYGESLAACAKLVKQELGNVPVLLAAAGLEGPPEAYLGLQKAALMAGLDGLSRNQYGQVVELPTGKAVLVAPDGRTPFDLTGFALWWKSLEAETGTTKLLIAGEFGWRSFARPADSQDSDLGARTAFPSKAAMERYCELLASTGYRGFLRFMQAPEATWPEAAWLAELKPTLERLALIPPPPPTPLTELELELLARQGALKLVYDEAAAKAVCLADERVAKLLARHPEATIHVEWDAEFGQWFFQISLGAELLATGSLGDGEAKPDEFIVLPR